MVAAAWRIPFIAVPFLMMMMIMHASAQTNVTAVDSTNFTAATNATTAHNNNNSSNHTECPSIDRDTWSISVCAVVGETYYVTHHILKDPESSSSAQYNNSISIDWGDKTPSFEEIQTGLIVGQEYKTVYNHTYSTVGSYSTNLTSLVPKGMKDGRPYACHTNAKSIIVNVKQKTCKDASFDPSTGTETDTSGSVYVTLVAPLLLAAVFLSFVF